MLPWLPQRGPEACGFSITNWAVAKFPAEQCSGVQDFPVRIEGRWRTLVFGSLFGITGHDDRPASRSVAWLVSDVRCAKIANTPVGEHLSITSPFNSGCLMRPDHHYGFEPVPW